MTYAELVAGVRRLSAVERLALLEVLARSLREDFAAPARAGSSLERVRGMARPDGPLPSDQELHDAYVDYLVKKYA
jgi:hypothetical protein